ncbi:28S ribosomal protein S34 mitochondrial [Biomphalaria pfeifferi]|uniref:28S ribosomal protein S34 mitochondrial n=1 Tax=Biomphalaria pfeifferi TaxID=112525 RepID=A0AAD8BGL9_BIOPF|nr:28S ribosomal protein S34 mitochondrial [Biomphalaria pfeifferi]
MPIRYIGRDPFFKGKSLFEISRQLRDFGVGRIVYQTSEAVKWPNQKTYYRLTKVVPDMTCKETFYGTAWGQLVFRGKEMGVKQIDVGHQLDWVLVPKHEEKDFCQTEVYDIDINSLPKTISCPPLLEMALKRDMKASKQNVPTKIEIPFYAEEFANAISRRWEVK